MFKVNNKNTRTTSRRRSGVFIVNFEHISHLFLVFLLLTVNASKCYWVPNVSTSKYKSNPSGLMEKVLIYPLSTNDVYIPIQSAVACSKPTMETPEQCFIELVSLLLVLNRFKDGLLDRMF